MNISYDRFSDRQLYYLSAAIRSNTVRQKCLLLISLCPYLFFTIQTLTTLALMTNEMGDRGLQYLANAIENNQVDFIL
jgi:hypothetical protein